MDGFNALLSVVNALNIKNMPSGIGLVDNIVKRNVLDKISVLKLSVEEGFLDGNIRYELNRNKVECHVVRAENDIRTIRFVYLKSKNMFEMVSLESFQENYKEKIIQLCQDSR